MNDINRWRGRGVPLRNTLLYFGESLLPQSQHVFEIRAFFAMMTPLRLSEVSVNGPTGTVDVTSQFSIEDFTFTGSRWVPNDPARLEAILKSTILAQYSSQEFMIPRCGPPTTCVIQTGEDVIGDVKGTTRPTGDDVKINPCDKFKISFSADLSTSSTSPNTPKPIFGSVGQDSAYSFFRLSVNLVMPSQKIGGDSGCPLDLFLDVQSALREFQYTDTSSVFQQAYEKAHGNAMELLVTVIEAGKTGAYISNKLMEIARLLVSMKKKAISGLFEKRSSSPIKIAKATASAWTQLRYAVMPLVYDVQGAITASNSSFLLATIIRGFSKLTGESSMAVTAARTYGTISSVLSLSGDIQLVEKAVAYGKVRAVDNHASTRFNRIYGGDQLFSTIWELVPWSFVIDWFYDVGTYLKNCTPLTGYTFAGYSHTIINKKTLSGSCVIGSGANERTVKIYCSVSLYRRRPVWSMEKVSLTAGNGLNPTRIADAVSLIINKVL